MSLAMQFIWLECCPNTPSKSAGLIPNPGTNNNQPINAHVSQTTN